MTDNNRRAVIDIGSNTIRLVVFGGSVRAPVVLFNEKLLAGLGRGVIADGAMSQDAMAAALAALGRFKILIDSLDVASLDVVATAAVRDARNGHDFLASVRELGLPARLLSGEEEAEASGLGVIAAMPGANGIVADLGGGSLELVRVEQGRVLDRVSLPIGILNVPAIRAQSPGKLCRLVQKLIADIPWMWRSNDLPLYLVGGSWRALARAHIYLTGFPLPVLGNHGIGPEEARALSDQLDAMDRAAIKAIPGIPSGRVSTVGDAAALLAALSEAISPSQLVICAFGLREGLLYKALSDDERAKDPLIEGVRYATRGQEQFPGHGDALTQWISPLFADEPYQIARLRNAVCLMVGTGWASNPDFRAVSGEELALHGNWVGIDPQERALMGMALYVGLGGSGDPPAILSSLATDPLLAMAHSWGLALRLAQRLSGGASSILGQCRIDRRAKVLALSMPKSLSLLVDDTLHRRLDRLGNALGASASTIEFSESIVLKI